MAKYNLDNYLEKDGLGFPLNFRRGNPNPLDNSSVWKSLADAQNYAQTDPTAYVGQILSVVNYTPAVTDDEGGIVTASQSTVDVYYIKDETGSLEPVGTSPVGDEGTITVAEDGTVSLYGIDGLDLTRTEEDGNVVNITYQPLYVNGKLTWIEPSATTVEGLATEIEGLKTRISTLENTSETHSDVIDAINAKVGEVPEGKTVVQMIADAQTAATYDDTDVKTNITTLESLVGEEPVSTQIEKETKRAQGIESGLETRLKAVEDDYLKGSDKTELSEAIEAAEESAVNRVLGYLAEDVVNEKYDTLKEVAAWIESDTTASAELITRVSNIEKDYLKGSDKTELQGAIDDLEAFVGALPEGVASTTVVAYIQEAIDALKIGDYAKVADLTALAGRVTALEGLIGGKSVSEQIESGIVNKVDKVEGSRLLTSDEATKLEKLVLGENGEVSVSGKVAAGNVDGLDAWITARAATLEGLSENNLTDTLLTKLNGVAEGAQVNVIDTVSDEFTVTGKNLAVNAIAQSKVIGLVDALSGKVDAEDGYRLISETELERVADIETGAQVNVLDGVQINGTLLDIIDKKVNIPVATAEKLGVVMASNEVTVADSGALGIGVISVAKIVNDDEMVLVLDGGASA